MKLRPGDSEDRKKVAQLERDIKQMKKDHRETFAEFNKKKSLPRRIADRFKDIFSR